MFMQKGRKFDKTLTSLFKFDSNTATVLERLVQELHGNKELCIYQFLNHPGSEDMLSGILKLIGNEDVRVAGNACYVLGSLAETELGCSRITTICMSVDEDESDILPNLTSLLQVQDCESVLNAAATLGTIAENDDGRMWLLRQGFLNETIAKLSLLLSVKDTWIASNAALVLARLTIAEEGCARILNHPQSLKILEQLIKSLKNGDQGVEMNSAFATGRLCDLHTGRVKLLQHKESNLMLDSLLLMLEKEDIGCRKNGCFAISCLATDTNGHGRILKNKHHKILFPSILKMLKSEDKESVWFSVMAVRIIASQIEGNLALRKDDGINTTLCELHTKTDLGGDTMKELNEALELLEKLPKPNAPDIQVESAYVICARWDKIYPISGLEVTYELYRDNDVLYQGDEDSFIISDVKPVTNYSFRLQITSAGGNSPFSDVVSVSTPESVPDAPQSLICLNRTTNQIKIAWQPPVLTNGQLLGYQLNVKGPKVMTTPFQETNDKYYILSGLLPGTQYTFEVFAVTGQGRGDPAILNIFTVDLSHHAPAKPKLSVLGRQEIQVEWDTPKYPLSRINSYEVKCNDQVFYNGNERFCILRRLQPDTEYSVTVSAWTNEGRCESIPSKRRTNRNTSIPVGKRLPLYPYQK